MSSELDRKQANTKVSNKSRRSHMPLTNGAVLFAKTLGQSIALHWLGETAAHRNNTVSFDGVSGCESVEA